MEIPLQRRRDVQPFHAGNLELRLWTQVSSDIQATCSME